MNKFMIFNIQKIFLANIQNQWYYKKDMVTHEPASSH